jgi:integrase
MRRSHLDDPNDPKVWVTPTALTKTKKNPHSPKARKRTYVTPLPMLVRRIIRGLPKGKVEDPLVFLALPTVTSKAGEVRFHTGALLNRLGKLGVRNFVPHRVRHTLASWLETQGCSEWERGLVLNHAESSVTSAYSHGHATKLKLELLEKWAAHVEALVTPAEGVTVLR